MTSIVGILCKDGAVIGTDSAATFGNGKYPTIEQPVDKIAIVDASVIVAGTGQVGLGQRFTAVVERGWSDKVFQQHHLEAAKRLCTHTIQDFASTHAKMGQYGALVAYPCNHRPMLCEFSVSDFQPEMKTEDMWYCSLGCAQSITDPFLALMRDVYWSDGMPTVSEAVFAATWTLDHAVSVNPGGVNGPVRIAVLEKDRKGRCRARLIPDDELGEHRQNIEEAKAALREYRSLHREEDGPTLPSVQE